MLKQDYLIRMIQEILSFLIGLILQRKKARPQEWQEYEGLTHRILGLSTDDLLHSDAELLKEKYIADPDGFDKMELAAVYQLMMADDLGEGDLVARARLKEEALILLKYIQLEGKTFSLSRVELINFLEKENF